jgi:hypothetical protein
MKVNRMPDSRQSSAHPTSESNESKMPSVLATEIRRLSHDLSNALEVVLQTNYLLGMTAASGGPSEEGQKWREMLDQGVLQAAQINRQLREYVRAHS